MTQYNKIYRPESSANISSIMGDDYLISRAATEAAIAKQFPIQTAHLIAIATAAQAVSMAYCVDIGSMTKPIGIYALGEQPPGTSKTGILDSFQVGIKRAIAEINTKRRKVLKEIEQSAKDNKGVLREAEEESLANNFIIKAPMTDVTAESVDMSLSGSGGWFMLASSEKGLVNTMIGGAYSDTSSNKDLLLKGFDGEWHSSSRVTRNGFSGVPHGSIVNISQDGTIDTVLRSSEGSGLVERFLIVLEGNMFGNRDTSKYLIDTPELNKLNDTLYECALQAANLEGAGFENLRKLKLSKGARDLMFEAMNGIEPLLADGERYSTSLFRGIWSKLYLQASKIAAVLHVTEGWDEHTDISVDHMAVAICVAKEILQGMVTVCETKGISGKNVELATAEDYLEKSARGLNGKNMRQIKDALSKKEVFKQHGNTKMRKIEECIATLMEMGVVEKRMISKNETFVYRG